MIWLIPTVPLLLSAAAGYRARKQLKARNARALAVRQAQATQVQQAQQAQAVAASPVFGGAAAAPQPPPAEPVFKAAVEPTKFIATPLEEAAGIAPAPAVMSRDKQPEQVSQPPPTEQAKQVLNAVTAGPGGNPIAVLNAVRAVLPPAPPPNSAFGSAFEYARTVAQQQQVHTSPASVLNILQAVLPSGAGFGLKVAPQSTPAGLQRTQSSGSFESVSPDSKGRPYSAL